LGRAVGAMGIIDRRGWLGGAMSVAAIELVMREGAWLVRLDLVDMGVIVGAKRRRGLNCGVDGRIIQGS
jgi:hypothetical protein